jgi:sigma-B regulation protein RsbU (phosphoserine phosphatase)
MFEEKKLKIEPGDKIIFYTDGLTEARNSREEEFEDDFMNILERKGNLPIGKLVEKIHSKLYSFNNGNDFQDDVCLIGMEVE